MARSFKERARERRATEIVQMAGQMMREPSGIDLNMDELAEAVGISKPTLYQHFKTKDDLVAHVMHGQMQEVRREIEALAEEDNLMALRAILRIIMQRRYSFGAALSNLSPDVFLRIMDSYPMLAQLKAELSNRIYRLIEQGKEQGQIVPHIPTPIIVRSFFCAIGSLSNLRTADQEVYVLQDLDTAIDQAIDLYLGGIRTSH